MKRLSSASALFRFPEARKRAPEVDAWLAKPPEELRAMARRWFERMRRCGPDVREVMHDGAPTACVEDAAFAYVNVYTAHVNVGFFRGAELPDPAELLEGTGKSMRHVKLRPGEVVDEAALEALIDASYRRVEKLLRPAVKLPVETYTPERVKEFDAEERTLAELLALRKKRRHARRG